MSIQIIDGNLLDAFDNGEVDMIAHCVNCQGVMGSGIALQIKNNYLEAYRRYMQACCVRDSDTLLGACQVVQLNESSPYKIVANLFGQYDVGTHQRQLNYGAISDAFKSLERQVKFYYSKSIGFPYKIGCDRAGGDWGVVQEMIEYYFKNYEVKIYKL